MDFSLNEDQRLIVDSVRAFVERELQPHEEKVEHEGKVPEDLAADIKAKAIKQGLYAFNMPQELGGGGLDAVTSALVDRVFGRTSYALHYLVARPSNILRACTEAQVEEYLLPTIRGERLECVAMTEPDVGSDLLSMRTTAKRDGDDYVINGCKHFISKADTADYVILFAATGEEESSGVVRKKVTGFLIDKGTPGLTVRKGYQSLSHRGYNNCILELESCRVPASNVLGEEHTGFEVAKTWLSSTRLQIAAMCLGRAERALELATVWAANRKQFGRTIGRFQGTGFKLADMATELSAAEWLTFNVAWKHDEGIMTDRDAAMAKLFATEMLSRVADHAVQIFGGMGVMEENPIARIWRDARVERIWDGTSEIQRHIIARSLLRPHETQQAESSIPVHGEA